MRKIKTLVFIKLLLLIGAMILAWCLIFVNKSPAPVEQSTIIILDVSSGMMTQDIATTTANDFITRLDAAKKIIQKIVSEFPQRSFGLITYWPEIDYLIPSTFDSGTLLQYTNSLLVQSAEIRVQNVGTKNTPTPWTLNSKLWTRWSTWLVAALQDKQLIILGDVKLPKSLLKNAQIIPLDTYKTFNPENSLTRQHVNISTVQTQWLIIILCLLVILSI